MTDANVNLVNVINNAKSGISRIRAAATAKLLGGAAIGALIVAPTPELVQLLYP